MWNQKGGKFSILLDSLGASREGVVNHEANKKGWEKLFLAINIEKRSNRANYVDLYCTCWIDKSMLKRSSKDPIIILSRFNQSQSLFYRKNFILNSFTSYIVIYNCDLAIIIVNVTHFNLNYPLTIRWRLRKQG